MHPLKAFIVEDSPVIRDSLIATLEELLPLTVVGTAEDESSATRWLTQPAHQVDLVIVDIFLKTGSGLGVLRSAQGLPQGRRMVVFSNCASSDMRRKCLQLGADRVFDKSGEIDDLVAYCDHLARSDAAPSLHGARR